MKRNKTIVIYYIKDLLPHFPKIHSLVHSKAWTVSSNNEVRYWSSTLPPILKEESDATVEIGIVSTSRANWESIG